MSVVFNWDPAEFDALVRSCADDDVLPFILRYIPKEEPCIEAGCGLGRFVIYLSRLGFQIEGIELSEETVQQVQARAPTAPVRQGDVTAFDHADDSVGGVISLGVIEHFIEGPERALAEIRRILRPGGHAVITVPCYNRVRVFKDHAGYYFFKEGLKNLARPLLGKKLYPLTWGPLRPGGLRYSPFFFEGEFFEYRLTPQEFEAALTTAGFEIVESVPSAFLDGLYHELGRAFVRLEDRRLIPTALGAAVDRSLRRWPFFHAHMHLCVVRKLA